MNCFGAMILIRGLPEQLIAGCPTRSIKALKPSHALIRTPNEHMILIRFMNMSVIGVRIIS